MAINVIDAFDHSFMTKLILKRPDVYLDELGIWRQGLVKERTFLGVVLPINSEPAMLASNNYISRAIEVYTATNLNHQTNDKPADIIRYNGYDYQVIQVSDYNEYGGWVKVTAKLIEGSLENHETTA